MKNQLVLVVAITTLLASSTVSDETVQVRVNGALLPVAGLLRDGTTYVPLRAVTDALGGRSSFDGKTAAIELPKVEGVAMPVSLDRGDSFWAEEYALTATQAAEFRQRATTWATKASALLDLVDISKLDLGNKELTDAVRGSLQWKRDAYPKDLAECLAPDLFTASWYALGFVKALCDTLDGVIDMLAEFRTLYLTHERVSGFPSPELIASMTLHSYEGDRLAHDLKLHYSALVAWYNKYPSPALTKQ